MSTWRALACASPRGQDDAAMRTLLRIGVKACFLPRLARSLLWWFLQQRLGGLKRDAVDEGGCRVQLGRSSRRRAMHPWEAPDVDTVGAESYLQANPCQLQEISWRSMEPATINNVTDLHI